MKTDIIIKNSRNTQDAPICPNSTQTVAFSHYNNFSAQLPIDAKTGKIVNGGIKEQTKQCLTNIKTIIESIGHIMDDVVKINIFLKDIKDLDAVNSVYKTFFPTYLPIRTVLQVAAIPLDGALVQMDTLLSNGEGTTPQEPCPLLKAVNNTENAPDGVYSQTVAFSHYNNISAQLPIDPKTGKLIAGGIKEQTAKCLRNIKNILESIDVPFDDIVKINIYLKELSDLDAVNEVYTTFFPDSAIARTVAYMPARTIVAASALPMGALVQIDASVSHGDGTIPQEVEDRHGIVIRANNTDKAPLDALYSQTVAFSHYNHIAGQLPIDPKTSKIISGGVKEQVNQCLTNIKAIVESIGHVMDDTVKINIALKDISNLDTVNEVYRTFFKGDLPARTVIGVNDIPMNAQVQIDAVISNAEGTPPTSK